MPNEKLDTADMPKYIVTIREVESKTGFDFLSEIDQRVHVVPISFWPMTLFLKNLIH